MKPITFIALLVCLTACKDDEGQDNGDGKTIMLLLFLGIASFVVLSRRKVNKERDVEIEEGQDFNLAFKNGLEEMDFITSNSITSESNFGLAVSDDLKSIAVLSKDRTLTIYDRDKIVMSDYKINYNQSIRTGTWSPFSWTTPQTRNDEIINIFSSADLFITLQDIHRPILKFRFIVEAHVEKYNALVNLVIKNKET